MKSTYITLLILFALAGTALAQKADPSDHVAIKTVNWDIINDLSYKMDKNGDFEPVFSERLKALNGKLIDLKGYIVPFKVGNKQKNFAISVLPISQCYFCGQGNIPPMVEIVMEEPIPYTDKIIVVKGKVKLNPHDVSHMEVILEQAKQVD